MNKDGDAATLRYLRDRQAILDCIMRYARGVDRYDRELVLSAYHPDAVDDHGMFIGSPEGFVDWVFKLQDPGQALTQHHITNHTCDIDGDVAHAETYYLATAGNLGGDTLRASSGRYINRFERRNGAWKIAMHYCTIEWKGTFPGNALPFANVHLNGVPSRGPEDPSYRRPLVNKRPIRAPTDPIS